MKHRLALAAYVLCVVLTVVTVVDFPWVLQMMYSARLHGLGFLDNVWLLFGLYPLEFIAFVGFRRARVGNKYLSVAMMSLIGVAIAAWICFLVFVVPHMNMAPH